MTVETQTESQTPMTDAELELVQGGSDSQVRGAAIGAGIGAGIAKGK